MPRQLSKIHESITAGAFGVFRTHIKTAYNYDDNPASTLNDDRLVYRAESDTEHLDAVRRMEDEIREEVTIPKRVKWNGDTYRFVLKTRSIRESNHPHGQWHQVYDGGGYGYELHTLRWLQELASTSGTIEVDGHGEVEYPYLVWNRNRNAKKCPQCELEMPDCLKSVDGGFVEVPADELENDPAICLACACEAFDLSFADELDAAAKENRDRYQEPRIGRGRF